MCERNIASMLLAPDVKVDLRYQVHVEVFNEGW
jgi:hypothetical protein